ncbi:MAG: hypothetical protein A2X86_17695 [Bdellovibrionales bacterium GWA2_49_15]|nr:MAG: hypothetical protein A2X86_17695 [Bdellovibrionales bacterium GWA2_49_15]
MNLTLSTERWLSVEEIACHLGVSKESVYRWVENGKMPAHKLGRQWKFKTSQIDAWLINGCTQKIKLNGENK